MKTIASILVKGVKQRFYFTDTVFLPNDTEFEIEFFNKSQRTVCPAISINGEKLASSPVVYNGQKFILKDFIDDNRKLLFTVYEVDSNDEDVRKAIQDNGIISIKYYYEKLIKRIVPELPINEQSKEFDGKISYQSVDLTDDIRLKPTFSENLSDDLPLAIETGKIMKGSHSNVTYKTIKIDLDYNDFETQVIKLKPISTKPKFINCPKCRNTSKIDANYCEVCGHQYYTN
jgi:hypothetical protein